MIVILSFCLIFSLSIFPSIPVSGLTATVTAYFDIHTGSALRIVESIRHNFFHIDNLQSIGFLDSSGKPTLIFHFTHRTIIPNSNSPRSTQMTSFLFSSYSSLPSSPQLFVLPSTSYRNF